MPTKVSRYVQNATRKRGRAVWYRWAAYGGVAGVWSLAHLENGSQGISKTPCRTQRFPEHHARRGPAGLAPRGKQALHLWSSCSIWRRWLSVCRALFTGACKGGGDALSMWNRQRKKRDGCDAEHRAGSLVRGQWDPAGSKRDPSADAFHAGCPRERGLLRTPGGTMHSSCYDGDGLGLSHGKW